MNCVFPFAAPIATLAHNIPPCGIVTAGVRGRSAIRADRVFSNPFTLAFVKPHWSLWLVLCVAWFAALAPTVSHALAWGQVSELTFIEVCSTTGARVVAVDNAFTPADSNPGQESPLTLSHCPFCLQPTDRCAPPPHPLPYLFLVQGGQQEAPVWQAFFYSEQRSFAPPPRGPPARL
jgi:hypothetical protein